ncbi:MAG: (deoxy)nucleoside triphosphate pyrophosphohydrolase [Deltaproteobacteria bacterium]|nr:(deoxy)nucleoside triphosphate pyrophosphohydrolase [Deltaproteobacteria bacterium]
MNRSVVHVVAALIQSDAGYLITKRANHAVLPGFWEFPGGMVEQGEQDRQALVRELGERLGIEAEVGDVVGETEHDYEDYSVRIRLYEAFIRKGEPEARHVAEFRWVPSTELARYPFPPADRATMDQLLGMEGRTR